MEERSDRAEAVREPPAGLRARLPDLLTGVRLVLGPLFVGLLPGSPLPAFLVAIVASVSDFVDGKLARRLGVGSTRGAILDVVCDGVFVLCGLVALAWAGTLSWALPAAALVSLLALARAWWRNPPRPGQRRQRTWPDRIGHGAGVLNYGAVCVGAGFLALGISFDLLWASRLVALVNVLPILMRWIDSRRAG